MDLLKKIKSSIKLEEYVRAICTLNDDNTGACPCCKAASAFSVSPQNQNFRCDGCGIMGDVFNFVMEYFKKDFNEAKDILAKHAKIKLPVPIKKRIVSTYDYTDEKGSKVYEVVKLEKPKDFRTRLIIDGKPVYKIKGIKPVPYRLNHWTKDNAYKLVYYVCSEDEVHAIESLGFKATCNHGGKGKFYDTLKPYFKDYNIVVVPDNSNTGREHARRIAAVLADVAKQIKIIVMPLENAGEGVVEWIDTYKATSRDLLSRTKAAKLYKKDVTDFPTPPPEGSDSQGPSLSAELERFDWPHQKDNGQPLTTEENFRKLLEGYNIEVAYNVISKEIDIKIPGKQFSDTNSLNCNLTKIQSLCQMNRLSKDMADPYLNLIGDENPINPVLDWITSKEWDGKSRLEDFCNTIKVHPRFPESMRNLLLRKWLISCCASASMDSGYIGKGVLTFQGDQDIGKTSWVRSLVNKDLQKYVKDNVILDPSNKDSVMGCIQHWIVEFGELDGTFRKSDPAKLKGFISSNCDVVRRPYQRKETRFHRRTTFFASVNDTTFLVDKTGNVRFWVIPIVGLNPNHKIDMQQLWHEMYLVLKEGENWWLDPKQSAELAIYNAVHEEISPIEELIYKIYDLSFTRSRWLTATEVLQEIEWRLIDKGPANECSRILKRIFGEAKKKKKGRCFFMPFPLSKSVQDSRIKDAGQENLPGMPEEKPEIPDAQDDPSL